jgi:hypothetical protein
MSRYVCAEMTLSSTGHGRVKRERDLRRMTDDAQRVCRLTGDRTCLFAAFFGR